MKGGLAEVEICDMVTSNGYGLDKRSGKLETVGIFN